MNRASLSSLRLLCNLRWAAIAGQALTVLIVTGPMGLAFPGLQLWSCIAALALFNLFATWRVRTAGEVHPVEIFLHLLVDSVALAWLIAWSGGADNPFSSLFLLPIALAILSLPPRWVFATACASSAGYAVSWLFGRSLPHIHGVFSDAFSLHKAGMLANFVISAVVLLLFLARMAAAWRQSEEEVARLREQFARNEGIVALATHAASVAHELNTPLGTMTLITDDLARLDAAPERREDYATLRALIDLCRDRVRELAAPADAGAQSRVAAPQVDLEQVIERWRLVRPGIELIRAAIPAAGLPRVEPGIGHLLQALLNNAADASEQAGEKRVDLTLRCERGAVQGAIRDYGARLDRTQPLLPSSLFRTSKPDGMGIGLALSHATVERLGGELTMQPTAEGRGVQVNFRLPLRGSA